MLVIKSILSEVARPSLSTQTQQAFKAANQAMAELFTAGCIGSLTVQQGYLNPTIVQSLSKTCFSILLPLFLGTSIMSTVKRYGLDRTSITMPVVAIVHCLALFFASKYVLFPLFGMESDTVEGRATNVCCAFGNSGVVPLIFVEALFRTRGGDFLQKASSQVSMYLLGWSPLFWSFGRNALLSGLVTHSVQTDTGDGSAAISWKDQIKQLKSLFPPPVVGVCIGLLLSTPLLRNLVMSYSMADGTIHKAPLEVVFNCCQNLGRAANPLALLVLTSSLALGYSKKTVVPSTNNSKDKNKNIIETNNANSQQRAVAIKRWMCVSLSRFVLSPLLMIGILKTLEAMNIIGSIDSKGSSMAWFILMLEATMPCAQNSVLMLQASEKSEEASRLAKFLFFMYASSMVPVVLVSTIMLEKCNFMTS